MGMTVLSPSHSTSNTSDGTRPETHRVGVVSFLNTLPLIAGLEGLDGWHMQSAAPSALVGLLADDTVDVALCSSIDLLRAPFEPAWIASTPLASDGATHTVRLFSRVPIERITRVAGDCDSHTSVALLKVLLARLWDSDAEVVDDSQECDAILRIGDKVVDPNLSSDQWPVQIDLGAAWRELTGLPFVFAVWMGRSSNVDQIVCVGRVIDRQYRFNRMRLEDIVSRYGDNHGWTSVEAIDYLRDRIRYEFSPAMHAGLERFASECRALHLVSDRPIPPPVEF